MRSSGRCRKFSGAMGLLVVGLGVLLVGAAAQAGGVRLGSVVAPARLFGVEAGASSARSLETMTISNTDPKPKRSATVLKPSHRYRLVGSGTVSDWCDGGTTPCNPPLVLNDGVDALYCYATWRCPKPELWRQLQVNGMGLDQLAGKAGKLPYSSGHVYTVEVTGISGALTVVAADATWSAGGNSGQFTLTITDLGVGKDTRKPNCVRTYVIRPSGETISVNVMGTELTQARIAATIADEKKKYEGHDYTPIGKVTRKQDCAGYVMARVFGSVMVEANVNPNSFFKKIVKPYGSRVRGGRVTADKGDIVVYRAGTEVKHVAIVEAPGGPIILTKDGNERLYRAVFPLVSSNDPLVQAHGPAEFWHLDRSRVSIAVIAGKDCGR